MSKLTQLVEELIALSAQEFPDLPASMHIEKHDPATVDKVAGFSLPAVLKELYCTGVLVTESWPSVSFDPPSRMQDRCTWCNDDLVSYSPPMRVMPGVREPVVFGEKLIPFAYHADSAYCVDLAPDVATGGVAQQIVKVSLAKGVAKVVFPTLEAFLQDGLKKMRREIKRRHAQEEKQLTGEGVPEAQEMMRDPLGFMNGFVENWAAGVHAAATIATARQWTAEERRDRAAKLVASNPRSNRVQELCAELVELLGRSAEFETSLRETLPPLSAENYKKIDRWLKIPLPPALVNLLDAHQRIGIPWDNFVSIGLDVDVKRRCKVLSAIRMPADNWALWPGTAVPVFGTGLIPLGGDGDPVICFDLQPGEGGTFGQLVEVSFEEARCKVIASSLEEFLRDGVARLRRGAT